MINLIKKHFNLHEAVYCLGGGMLMVALMFFLYLIMIAYGN
ncbi:MAG: hypothetical protein PHX21_12670 [bacterium]|nr:hypothetical protein [bacterium]